MEPKIKSIQISFFSLLIAYYLNWTKFNGAGKSTVCEEDPYFKELVRYIHLNPIRAKMVQAIKDLDRYRWSGHAAIVGKVDYAWMDCDYVLRWFGETVRGARISYREFEEENGIEKWIKVKGERLKDRKRIETKTGSFHI